MKLRFDKYLSILKLVFSIVFTSITTFLSFIPLDKIGITNICTKILILIILLVFCFFLLARLFVIVNRLRKFGVEVVDLLVLNMEIF